MIHLHHYFRYKMIIILLSMMIIYFSRYSAEDVKLASVKHIAFWYIHAKDENPNKSLQSQLSIIQLSGLEDRMTVQ